jgi:hypothetical protein
MRALTVTGIVTPDHLLKVVLPSDITPGPHTIVIVLEDATGVHARPAIVDLTPHPVGLVDSTQTFRREDLYGDDAR